MITLMRPLLRREPPPPPVVGRLPDFSLVAASGEPFGSENLRGKVWVASFFFTRCPSICPELMKSMAELQRRYAEERGLAAIRLVSISVDPANDTPERLREAAGRYGVDPARWVLLTGDPDRVRDLCVNGFKLAMSDPVPGAGGAIDIAHSGKLVLVDPDGGIRGYYASDEMGIDEVFWRSTHVLHEAERKRESAG
jgi:protein SCO1/2